jgi:hypothetical protein
MNLAVRLYSSIDPNNKPSGIPDNWVSDVIELSINDTKLPDNLSANDGWIFMTDSQLSDWKAQYRSEYDIWYSVAKAPSLQNKVTNRILQAMEFGKQIMAEYAAENVLAGLTIPQIQDILLRTAKIQSDLMTGSLYTALVEIDLVQTDDMVVTPTKVKEFRNKIQVYLGLPLS